MLLSCSSCLSYVWIFKLFLYLFDRLLDLRTNFVYNKFDNYLNVSQLNSRTSRYAGGLWWCRLSATYLCPHFQAEMLRKSIKSEASTFCAAKLWPSALKASDENAYSSLQLNISRPISHFRWKILWSEAHNTLSNRYHTRKWNHKKTFLFTFKIQPLEYHRQPLKHWPLKSRSLPVQTT